jgi:hypothetical protein
MIPFPLKNELLSSYCARIARLNNGKRFYRTQIYGKAKAEPANPFFCGFGHLDKFIKSHGRKADTFFQNGILPFFHPFMPTDRYKYIKQWAYEHAESCGHLVPRSFLKSIRRNPAICPCCLQEDLEEYGFGYLRRQHQIRCNAICEIHHKLLLTHCPRCNTPLITDYIPTQQCSACDLDITNFTNSDSSFMNVYEPQVRISQAIVDIFRQKIKGNLNIDKFLGISNINARPKTILKLGIARSVLRSYDHSFLLSLNLHPGRPPYFGWPGLFLNGTWSGVIPEIELLLYGIHNTISNQSNPWGIVPDCNNQYDLPTSDSSEFDLRSLKCIFKYSPLENAAKSRGLSKCVLQQFHLRYPTLSDRLAERRHNSLIHHHRTIAIKFIEKHPYANRMDLKRSHVGTYLYLRKYDTKWWEANTHYRRPFKEGTNKNEV